MAAKQPAPFSRRAESIPVVHRRTNGPDRVHQLQRQIGNRAIARAIGATHSAAPALLIQRDPTGGEGPAPAPAPPATTDSSGGIGPPAPSSPLPPSSADSGGGPAAPAEKKEEGGKDESIWTKLNRIMDKKYRLRLGSHTLYSAAASKRFAWSKNELSPVPDDRLRLGVIPLPLPVGPVPVELGVSAGAFAGGSASFDIALDDVVLEVTVRQLIGLGFDAALLLAGPEVLPLVLTDLALLKLTGEAKLRGSARAKVEVGARAAATLVLNSALWPLAPYVQGAVGAGGSVSVEAPFAGGAQIEFSLGRLRVVDGFFETGVTPSLEASLNGSLTLGVIVGYRPLTHQYELWRHSAAATAALKMETLVQGGDKARMTTDGNGDPTIDLEPVLLKSAAILEALFRDRKIANDRQTPLATDPESPGSSAPGLGDIGKHGAKRDPVVKGRPRLWWLESEHIIPFATAKRMWEILSLAVPDRGSFADRQQTTILIYHGAARVKTPVDNEVSEAFKQKVREDELEKRLRRMRVWIDAGHGDAVKEETTELFALVSQALKAAQTDAAERTSVAIQAENAQHLDNHPLTNGQRRAPPGQSEPPAPPPHEIVAVAALQYDDIFNLATGDLPK